MITKQFIAQWGFCPHTTTTDLCADCLTDPSQRSYHMSELLDLTHERQVAIFGWCHCEEEKNWYTDCPTQ